MENIEILAELKAMYHFITDITENAEEEQIADNDFEEFEKMETFLEKQYAKMDIIIGTVKSEVLDSDERLVIL